MKEEPGAPIRHVPKRGSFADSFVGVLTGIPEFFWGPIFFGGLLVCLYLFNRFRTLNPGAQLAIAVLGGLFVVAAMIRKNRGK